VKERPLERFVYKIATGEQWAEAERNGVFLGAPVDFEDGYIHLSTADQVRDTAARFFAGQSDLRLVRVEADALGVDLRYELGGRGQHFPHLYASLKLSAVSRVEPLDLGNDGSHVFPEGFPG
jgi:uncharacterized protein (DUF952 family)